MSSMPKVSKIAIKNIISGVHIHNRIVEEDECWRQRRLEISKEEIVTKSSQPSKRKKSNYKRFKVDNHNMYQNNETIPQCSDGREPKTDNWMKLYDKIESTCPERWGHAGYKELYPEQFLSTDDELENHDREFISVVTTSKSRKRNKSKSSDDEPADDDRPVLRKSRGHELSDYVEKKHKKSRKRSTSSPQPKKLKRKKSHAKRSRRIDGTNSRHQQDISMGLDVPKEMF